MNTEQLQRVLEENWPPNRIQLRCEVCDSVLYDRVATRDDVPIYTPSYISTALVTHARSHTDDNDHDSFDIVIDSPPRVEREIDCTVTVQGTEKDIDGW